MKTRDRKQQKMFSHIKKWEASGISKINYCIDNHISIHKFKYWAQKYYSKDKQSHAFVPIQLTGGDEIPTTRNPRVELVLDDTLVLRIY